MFCLAGCGYRAGEQLGKGYKMEPAKEKWDYFGQFILTDFVHEAFPDFIMGFICRLNDTSWINVAANLLEPANCWLQRDKKVCQHPSVSTWMCTHTL